MKQRAVKATYGDLKRIIFPFGNLWELSNRLRCFHPTETMQKKGASPRQVNRIVHYLGEL